jgi:hypothetical protein
MPLSICQIDFHQFNVTSLSRRLLRGMKIVASKEVLNAGWPAFTSSLRFHRGL